MGAGDGLCGVIGGDLYSIIVDSSHRDKAENALRCLSGVKRYSTDIRLVPEVRSRSIPASRHLTGILSSSDKEEPEVRN